MVWLLHSRQRQKIHPLLTRRGDSPRRVNPLAVAVEQQRRHHHWMERRITTFFLVLIQDLSKIQLLYYQVADERHQLILTDKIHWRRREHHGLFRIPISKCLSHVRHSTDFLVSMGPITWTGSFKE